MKMPSANNKNITICSTSFFEYDRRLQRIISALQSGGYTIRWISRSKGSGQKISDVNHSIISTIFKSGILFYLEFNLRLLWRLLLLPKHIINAVDLDTMPACRLAGLIKNHPIVFDAHELFYEVPELTGKRIKKKIWKLIALWTIPAATKAYTVNHSLKDHYERHYKKSFDVIYNVPVLTDDSSSAEVSRNRQQIIYLGVLNVGRGLEIAIEAMSYLTAYKLILLGDGDIIASLKSQAGKLQLDQRINFAGYVSPKDIPAFLRQAGIGINILKAESENYRLSLANKFFDYMHAELPSVNMNYPEYRHILSKHEVGLAIDEYSVQAFVTAVRNMENDSRYTGMVDACAQAKAEYNWEKEVPRLLAIYNTISHP